MTDTLTTCPGVTVCATAAALWARLQNLRDNGTHREYMEAYLAYWTHECRSAS